MFDVRGLRSRIRQRDVEVKRLARQLQERTVQLQEKRPLNHTCYQRPCVNAMEHRHRLHGAFEGATN